MFRQKQMKTPKKELPHAKKHFLYRFSFSVRLLLLVLSMLIVSTGIIGYVSYTQAKDMLVRANVNRIKREIEVSRERAEYLKLSCFRSILFCTIESR